MIIWEGSSIVKNKRRYRIADVYRRRIEYIKFLFSKKDIIDLSGLSVQEFEKCQKDRGRKNRAELRCFSRMLKQNRNKLYIPRIAVSVTNQCSLRCRDCNNLMPYCKEKYHIAIEEQIADLKRILSYVDGIVNVEVIGGEPFVYKELSTLLMYLCDESKIHFVEVTTNGTVMPKIEILDVLKNHKVCVLLSDYGKVNGERARQTYRYLKQNKVVTRCLKNRVWILPGGIENREKNKFKMKYEYYHCSARKVCRTMYKGKLYVCGRAPILDELNLLSDKSSFLDIRNMNIKKSEGKKQIYNFFNNTYAESCNYCDCSSDASCRVESGIQN